LVSSQKAQRAVQAACALATYAPTTRGGPRSIHLLPVRLVSLEAVDARGVAGLSASAKGAINHPLALMYRNTKQKNRPASLRTETLADYAADRPVTLFDLWPDAELFSFRRCSTPVGSAQKSTLSALAQRELAKRSPDEVGPRPSGKLWRNDRPTRAVALFRPGQLGRGLADSQVHA